MYPRLLLSAAVLSGTLSGTLSLALVPGAAANPAPRGPSGVIQTMRAFLQALDQGDARMLDLLVGDDAARDGCVVVPDETSETGIRQVKKDGANRFFEVSWDGKPLVAANKKGFLKLLRKHVASSKVEARTLGTRLCTVRADCPSQWCSYAVVEFERNHTVAGVKQKPVPMQATALVRYVKREDTETPHFEIFHWHASPAGRDGR